MFGPLPHMNLKGQLLKLLDNLLNILHTEISNDIPCHFVFLWTSNGLETQIVDQPLSWYSQIIFWFWRCDFHPIRTNKFQRDVQGNVLIAVLDIPVFPNISTITIFRLHSFELTRCEFFLPERLLGGATMINRRCCYNWWELYVHNICINKL